MQSTRVRCMRCGDRVPRAAPRRAPQRARQVCSPRGEAHSCNAARNLSIAASMCNIRCAVQSKSSSKLSLVSKSGGSTILPVTSGFYKNPRVGVRARHDTSQSPSGTASAPSQVFLPHPKPRGRAQRQGGCKRARGSAARPSPKASKRTAFNRVPFVKSDEAAPSPFNAKHRQHH